MASSRTPIRTFNSILNIKGLRAGKSTAATAVADATASKRFATLYWNAKATSGSSYGLYNRLWISGACDGGDAFRSFCTINNVAVTSAARGAHISLSQGTTGSVSGLGAAVEATLHINTSGTAAGTLYGVKSAINSDSAASDPAGATTLAYFAAVNQGDATGGADVDTDAVLFHIDGHTISNDNMVGAVATAYELNQFTHGIKIKIGGTIYWIPVSNVNPKST